MSTAIQPKEKAVVFVSYAREDSDFVKLLVNGLEQRGIEPVGDWLLTAGQNYEVRLRELNLRSQALVFVISPDSINSEPCRNELALAVESKKQILPLSRRDHGEDSRLDSALRAPQWTILRDDDDFASGVDGLVRAINTDFDQMELHGRLLLASESWQNNGHNRSYLLRKDGLREAESWLAKTSVQPDKLPQPTQLEAEFILASQRARSRGTRIAVGVASAIGISLTTLTIVALAQRSSAVRYADESNRQAQIATQNESKANSNAKRAIEVGKRRLVIATLLLNPEGTKFDTVTTLPGTNDLTFGIQPWDSGSGTLKDILRRFQDEEPKTFVQIFGDGDPALAQRLIDYVTKPQQPREAERSTEADNDLLAGNTPQSAAHSEFNLTEEPWLSRFKRAGQNPALQTVQLNAFTEVHLRFLDQLNSLAPTVKTERGVAFLLDLVHQIGTTSVKRSLEEAQKAGPTLTEAELLVRVKEISMERFRKRLPIFAPAIERRRQMFLKTPLLSDQELGF